MNRVWQFDYLKTFAIILVIVTHAFYYNEVSAVPGIFPYMVDMAVPIFMIISGYVNTISYAKNVENEFEISTFIKYISARLIPIYVPYIILFLFEMILMYFIQGRIVGLHESIYSFLTGGWGPGSYYVCMMLQLIICFPFFYFLIRQNTIRGSLIILGAQFAFELLVPYTHMPESLYRLIFVRYFVFVWSGIILFYHQKRIKSSYLFCGALTGGLYIFLVSELHYSLPVFQYWAGTSMPTVLWAGTLVILGIRYLIRLSGIPDKIMLKTGVSTYSIFLVQMIYFQLGFGKISDSFLVNFFCSIIINCILGIILNSMFGKIIKKLFGKG